MVLPNTPTHGETILYCIFYIPTKDINRKAANYSWHLVSAPLQQVFRLRTSNGLPCLPEKISDILRPPARKNPACPSRRRVRRGIAPLFLFNSGITPETARLLFSKYILSLYAFQVKYFRLQKLGLTFIVSNGNKGFTFCFFQNQIGCRFNIITVKSVKRLVK